MNEQEQNMLKTLSKLFKSEKARQDLNTTDMYFLSPYGGKFKLSLLNDETEGQQPLTMDMVLTHIRDHFPDLIPSPDSPWSYEPHTDLQDERYGALGSISTAIGFPIEYQYLYYLQLSVESASSNRRWLSFNCKGQPSTFTCLDVYLEKFPNRLETQIINNLDDNCSNMTRTKHQWLLPNQEEKIWRNAELMATRSSSNQTPFPRPQPTDLQCIRDVFFQTYPPAPTSPTPLLTPAPSSIAKPPMLPSLAILSVVSGSSLLLAAVALCWLYKRRHREVEIPAEAMQRYGALERKPALSTSEEAKNFPSPRI
jgi:hypothetical protein